MAQLAVSSGTLLREWQGRGSRCATHGRPFCTAAPNAAAAPLADARPPRPPTPPSLFTHTRTLSASAPAAPRQWGT
jgi:hypothetical protein